MKKFLLILLSFFLILQIYGKEVPVDRAKETAIAFLMNQDANTLKSATTINLTLVGEINPQMLSQVSLHKSSKNKAPAYYIFNVNEDEGFVIISGDDAVFPVLGYSKSGTFDPNYLPDNLRKLLENYKKQINHVISNDIKATETILRQWKDIKENKSFTKSTKSVSPLLTTTWGQSPYVNDLCPYDVNAGAGNGYHAVTGCPATAMAQIMKYWNYPTTGTGFHSFQHDTYGNLSANFGSTTYDWASMPNSVNSANNAVATLMYHCGIAVEMMYGPKESSSYIIIAASPTPEQTSEYAYKTYFGYDDASIKGYRRDDYSDNDWKQLLKDDLDAGRPIQYAGFGDGGHTFVCDGYDNNDYFHMNWGWGDDCASYNSFYLLDALNPGPGGTGAGGGTYNDGQQAVIGIQPPIGNVTYNIELSDNMSVTPNPIYYGQEFTVHADFLNAGTNIFNGDYGAAIFDVDFNFIDFVEIRTGYSLQGGYHYTDGLDFTTTGILAVLPGTYHISMFYRPTDGNWIIINNGSYVNSIQLDVENTNDIALYGDIIVNTGDITQNQNFDVNVDIANFGSTDFSGSYDVNLYDLSDGSFVENVATKTSITLTAGYFNSYTFSTSGIIAEPGTYLLAVLHKEDGQDWELSGSQDYTNPIKVIVKVEPLQADIYEDNNTEKEANILPVSFSSNNTTILTTGSNNHIGSDLDYYKIEMETGYNYTINARAHDSYNSGNGLIYTNDVGWSYLLNSEWSDVYDDVMPNEFTVNNGGTLIFNVSPYFVGRTGTYLLDISISRTAIAFNISASVNPSNSGTISGAGNYNYGATAELIATPETGYDFVNWTEGESEVSTEATYSFTVDSNRTLVANFELQSLDITGSVNPSNSGTISGAGNYDYGATAELIATPETGYDFVNWTENETEISTNTNYSFTVTEDRTLIANFVSTTGIENFKDINFVLYPNPTNSLLNIKLTEISYNKKQKVKISLIDYLGRKHNLQIEYQYDDIIQVDLCNMNAGIYLLQIVVNNKIVKTKTVVITGR